ncbi:glyceraldehyde-3-phosphate dehydrogenase [Salegentibacter salinarum]|uniref:Glyceraldehyde-3-phosphate dehydrogenase n=1 Tax=Salegentibacter salinarum TaxID=447422 RepID=A0A2N0TU23_9FLAO|nr:type I glyceraldehyde-3-phosphate dehydrogenase [Salegentibacter salinarum]PKD18243.1 glyceraldehyde-3-phosphate dehydrogenase [Salegentibacter salinarum]SKB43289.1 glyceraldehyde 3-phosphate dehydrogenase [Salegentibacter salinarum]
MNKSINVAINGFGRIGRNLFRLLIDNKSINVVAINDLADAKTLAHILKYDSIHGVSQAEISSEGNNIVVNGKSIPLLNFAHPKEIDWNKFNIDTVIEATGKFKTYKDLQHHIENGAKKVILSVPPEDDQIKMVVLGVNEHILDGTEKVISNASCTTNNAAPMLKLIHENFKVEQAYITTIHSYTSDQSLHDKPHRDLRRSRAATQSIIPTTTGAAKALTGIFPDISNVIGGCGIRVPVPNGSLTDMTINVSKETNIEEINTIFKKASETSLKGILSYTEDPIVSIDINNNPHSCIFDALMTSVIGGKLIKIIGWYDNEIGYSSRLVDLISIVNDK